MYSKIMPILIIQSVDWGLAPMLIVLYRGKGGKINVIVDREYVIKVTQFQ